MCLRFEHMNIDLFSKNNDNKPNENATKLTPEIQKEMHV